MNMQAPYITTAKSLVWSNSASYNYTKMQTKMYYSNLDLQSIILYFCFMNHFKSGHTFFQHWYLIFLILYKYLEL